MRAQRAYDGFFRRVRRGETPGYPRFKPRSRYRTIEISEVSPSMLKVHGSELLIKIKGLPTIRTYPSRELPPLEQARSLQITRRNRAIDVSIQFVFTPEALQSTGRITALDPGVARRLTGSDGFSSSPIKRDRASATMLQKSISTFRERAFVSVRSDKCGGRSVILPFDAAQDCSLAHPMGNDALLSPTPQIGLSAGFLQHTRMGR